MFQSKVKPPALWRCLLRYYYKQRSFDSRYVFNTFRNFSGSLNNSLQRELESFLASLPSFPTVMAATPRGICRFLVYNDQSGKTQVHKNGCIYLGKKGPFKCGCPFRLSYNTVDSYIGKLRAIFHAVGRRGKWDLRLGLRNPAADSSVKDYLRLVTSEQLQARVTPRQGLPSI